MASEMPQSPRAAMAALRQRVWDLPDSQNPKALQAEQESRGALERSSIQDAAEALKRAVTLDPKFVRAWILLGEMQMAMMERTEGIEAFREAVAADTQQPLSYKLLGMALASLDRRPEAIQVWQDLAKVVPEDRDVASNLALLMVAEKRYGDAVPYLETALQGNPKSGSVLR